LINLDMVSKSSNEMATTNSWRTWTRTSSS